MSLKMPKISKDMKKHLILKSAMDMINAKPLRTIFTMPDSCLSCIVKRCDHKWKYADKHCTDYWILQTYRIE